MKWWMSLLWFHSGIEGSNKFIITTLQWYGISLRARIWSTIGTVIHGPINIAVPFLVHSCTCRFAPICPNYVPNGALQIYNLTLVFLESLSNKFCLHIANIISPWFFSTIQNLVSHFHSKIFPGPFAFIHVSRGLGGGGAVRRVRLWHNANQPVLYSRRRRRPGVNNTGAILMDLFAIY